MYAATWQNKKPLKTLDAKLNLGKQDQAIGSFWSDLNPLLAASIPSNWSGIWEAFAGKINQEIQWMFAKSCTSWIISHGYPGLLFQSQDLWKASLMEEISYRNYIILDPHDIYKKNNDRWFIPLLFLGFQPSKESLQETAPPWRRGSSPGHSASSSCGPASSIWWCPAFRGCWLVPGTSTMGWRVAAICGKNIGF